MHQYPFTPCLQSSLYVIADGHAGAHAAQFIEDNLLSLLSSSLPEGFPDLTSIRGLKTCITPGGSSGCPN